MRVRLANEVGRALVVVLLCVAALLVVAVAGGAGACKFTSLDCHLRSSPTVLSQTTGTLSLPPGFSAEVVASGLKIPTAFDFLPDGRILVAEKDGTVNVVEDGEVASTPVVDLSDRISTASYRGIVEVEVDPDFADNHYIYVVYTPRQPGVAKDATSPTHLVVSRFTLTGNTAGSEHVILGAAGEKSGTCAKLPKTADCLPSAGDHIGADIVFAKDRTLFISTGDGGGFKLPEALAFDAQDPDALGGKILHVTRDGDGVASNPFYTGDPTANRSKVWALGLRNPFRMTASPDGGLLVVGDVGERTDDEVDAVHPGDNLGWPCYEGRPKAREYKSLPKCVAVYARGTKVVPPIIDLPSPGSIAVTGGDFVTGTNYPKRDRGYYYGDWVSSWIRHADVDPKSGDLRAAPVGFARHAGGPVVIRVGPDGDLYVLSLNYRALYRISYSG
jgi:glucose/arabinose dehydrogenase